MRHTKGSPAACLSSKEITKARETHSKATVHLLPKAWGKPGYAQPSLRMRLGRPWRPHVASFRNICKVKVPDAASVQGNSVFFILIGVDWICIYPVSSWWVGSHINPSDLPGRIFWSFFDDLTIFHPSLVAATGTIQRKAGLSERSFPHKVSLSESVKDCCFYKSSMVSVLFG